MRPLPHQHPAHDPAFSQRAEPLPLSGPARARVSRPRHASPGSPRWKRRPPRSARISSGSWRPSGPSSSPTSNIRTTCRCANGPRSTARATGPRSTSSSNGERVEANARHCPTVMALLGGLDQPIVAGRSPNAMFSLLAPGAHIPPHTGVANTRLVCHLPLIVPPGCWFRVGAERRDWRVGEAWVFDDTIEHEAMNPVRRAARDPDRRHLAPRSARPPSGARSRPRWKHPAPMRERTGCERAAAARLAARRRSARCRRRLQCRARRAQVGPRGGSAGRCSTGRGSAIPATRGYGRSPACSTARSTISRRRSPPSRRRPRCRRSIR